MATARKIIFLDIDGPLLSHRAKQHPKNQLAYARDNIPQLPEPIDWATIKAPKGAELVRHFDELAVHLLINLLTGHSARLVISSSWQKAGAANIRFILEENGIPASFLHEHWKTDPEPADTRSQEIAAWLGRAAGRGEAISAYAALDDDVSVAALPGGVLVPYSDGIRWSDFCSASAALGGGIIVSDTQAVGGKLFGNVTKGALGEAVIFSHGNRTRQIELGHVDDNFGPAPPYCIRLRSSEYQLMRVRSIPRNSD